MKLTGKRAVITGGAQGIGLACAKRFAEDGCQVAILDYDREQGEQASRAVGGDTMFAFCDVSEKTSVDTAIQACVERFGGVDICVSNAAIVHSADFLEIEEADFDRVLRTNLKGVFLTGQTAARQMVAQGNGGAIINMSSVNAVMAIPDQVPYVVAKGGVAQLTKLMSLSLAKHHVRVNAIGPGSIMTELLKTAVTKNEGARDKILSRTPMGRIGEPSEVAAVASFLASDDASYVTGQTVYCDGGRLGLNYTVPVD